MQQTTDTLTTGMDNLDSQFTEAGLFPGSILTINSNPLAMGQVVAYSFLADRPTLHVTIGNRGEDTKDILQNASGVSEDVLTMRELSTTNFKEEFESVLEEYTSTAGGTNILIEPINLAEISVNQTEYEEMLSTLKSAVSERDGLAIIYAIDEEVPDTRWMTFHKSDYVFSIDHDITSNSVGNSLSMEKIDPRHSLAEAENRKYNIAHGMDIDIDTTRNLSP
jgi:hypothetical protein